MLCSPRLQARHRPANRASCSRARRCPSTRVACMASKADVSSHDLLVVGPGVLGSCVGKLWKDRYPDARVVGQSLTTYSHDSLKAQGFEVRTADEAGAERFPFVAFTARSVKGTYYPAVVRKAAQLWDGTGTMAYSGNASLYKTAKGPCDEDDDLHAVGTSECVDRWLGAEAAVLGAGGNVVRLVNLYNRTYGLHTLGLQRLHSRLRSDAVLLRAAGNDKEAAGVAREIIKTGTLGGSRGSLNESGSSVTWNEETVVNLIHYEDAARLMVAVLDGDGSESEFYRGQVFTGSDNHPLTVRRMIDSVNESGVLKLRVKFVGGDKQFGKLMDSSKTDARLGFKPKYSSFESFFLENKGVDFYHDQPPARPVPG